jgi:LacI family transcriptional regulator
MARVTIEHISRQTGFSRGTVSRALNNRPDISAQTKQRVLEACRELHYVPSHAARSLATGRRYAAVVIVDDLCAAFAGSFVHGAVACANAEHYSVHVMELGSDPAAAIATIGAIANERADAVLLAVDLGAALTAELKTALEGRPLVGFGPAGGDDPGDAFLVDYAEGGRLLAQHVLRPGEADVLYVHRADTPGAEQRLAAFREACQTFQVDPNAITFTLPPGEHCGDGGGVQELTQRLGRARAVVASDDFLALNLMLMCASAGRHAGRDLDVIGQGNEPFAARLCPGLTSLDFGAEEIGRRALEMAIQRVAKTRQDAPQRTLVAPTLIQRQTTRFSA